MDEIERIKDRYLHQIEDGKKIDAFTSMPEWQWYVEHVIKPTVDDYTKRIMNGQNLSNKQDWIMRGMVQAFNLVTETPTRFKDNAKDAKKKAKMLQEQIEEEA